MTRRILVVEDDPSLTRILRDNLTLEGFQVQCVSDGNDAARAYQMFVPDLVLLDIALPGKSGFELCQLWKSNRTPTIIVSARGGREDKLQGLSLGADDYITKPFDLKELLARIRAVLRRARPTVNCIVLGGVTIDFVKLEAKRGHRSFELSYREFDLLRYLAERPNSIVHRDELLREVWGYAASGTTRAVDHAIVRLRRKIERNPHRPRFIHSVYGDGYCITPEGSQEASSAESIDR